jgi:hypothetical protein
MSLDVSDLSDNEDESVITTSTASSSVTTHVNFEFRDVFHPERPFVCVECWNGVFPTHAHNWQYNPVMNDFHPIGFNTIAKLGSLLGTRGQSPIMSSGEIISYQRNEVSICFVFLGGKWMDHSQFFNSTIPVSRLLRILGYDIATTRHVIVDVLVLSCRYLRSGNVYFTDERIPIPLFPCDRIPTDLLNGLPSTAGSPR